MRDVLVRNADRATDLLRNVREKRLTIGGLVEADYAWAKGGGITRWSKKRDL